MSSFSSALSALSATSTAVDVVGNNLANLETTGFKSSSVEFQDMVTQSFGAGIGNTQVGFGVGRPITLRDFSQGALQSTNGALDAAIQGDGFLIVKNTAGATLYTRGGSLQVAKDGALLTASGDHIQGWNAAADGTMSATGPVTDIVVPPATLKPPVASQNFSFDLNLNASATAGPPADTFSSSIQLFDSLGSPHVATVEFTKNVAANQWDYSISVPDADVTTPITPVTGSITFDAQGKLLTPPAAGPMPAIAVTGLADGAADMNLTWNLYNGVAPRITQFTQASAISANAQDGNPPAQLSEIKLGDGGTVLAEYSDGTEMTVGQMAMASIRNPQSLTAVGNSDFQLSELSAAPAVGLPGTGGRGNILGGSLESSNVDIATEFTRLIVFQRGYQANAKVITAVDEITQATIALKQ